MLKKSLFSIDKYLLPLHRYEDLRAMYYIIRFPIDAHGIFRSNNIIFRWRYARSQSLLDTKLSDDYGDLKTSHFEISNVFLLIRER